jgi:hypothetical protein
MVDTDPATIPPELATRKFNAAKLEELFKLLKVKEAYYIDDYNKVNVLPYIITSAKQLFSSGDADKLVEIFFDKVVINVPDDDALAQNINQGWEQFDEEEQKAIVSDLLAAEGSGFNPRDYFRTRELQQSFPDEYLKLISPDEWEETLKKLEQSYKADSKVLILFDQDLKHAEGAKFKSGAEKGQHLIVNLKKSLIKESVYCILITHLIDDTSKELDERDAIIKEVAGDLTERDFFALSKDRIRTPDLLCDGIKKALLNGYCEEIKEHSKKIIEDAQGAALKKILKLDTYDFDHTVLRSSYNEGVWEMNTLFRIAGNFYDDQVKDLMQNSNYAKNVNPSIKQAKAISDVRFNIEPGTIPYKQKYSLRHQDIYEDTVINKLHLPLQNGDIFEVVEGKGKGYYILVAQECDLMMRTEPLGSRFTGTATFLKIKDFTRKELDDLILRSYSVSANESHFLSNKFRLDYFKNETNDIGLVKFTDTYVVDLDVLDLCVFNCDGKAFLDLGANLDLDLVSAAWGSRYERVVSKFKRDADLLDKILPEVNKLAGDIRGPVKKRIGIKLAPISELGKPDSYSARQFDFGVKRIMRLKIEGAKYLIDRYYKHVSRVAEQHDFAFEKIIKEGVKAVVQAEVHQQVTQPIEVFPDDTNRSKIEVISTDKKR